LARARLVDRPLPPAPPASATTLPFRRRLLHRLLPLCLLALCLLRLNLLRPNDRHRRHQHRGEHSLPGRNTHFEDLLRSPVPSVFLLCFFRGPSVGFRVSSVSLLCLFCGPILTELRCTPSLAPWPAMTSAAGHTCSSVTRPRRCPRAGSPPPSRNTTSPPSATPARTGPIPADRVAAPPSRAVPG